MALFEVSDPQYFDNLKRKVAEFLDFDCDEYSDSFLKRRFEVRLRKTQIDSYREYLHTLTKNMDERSALKKELTIHVTHFFRDKEFWKVFKNDIIPKIIKSKDEKKLKNIRIWSAGCSSGEEAISIAISFLEKLGSNLKGFNILITGTDYDMGILKTAEAATYEEFQFRETDGLIKEKYFKKTPEGKYTPINEIRARITFKRGDILRDTLPKNIDVIFCRNTVIYFNKEAKAKLYVGFFNVLNPRGFFVMGKTECLTGSAREEFKIVSTRERIYGKD